MHGNNALNNILIAAIQHLPIGIFWKDTQGRYLGCNKHYLDISGITSESQILDKTDAQLKIEFHDPLQAIHDDLFATDQLALQQGQSVIAQPVEFTADHGKRQFEITKIPLKNNQNHIVGLLGVAINVTSKFKYEQKLQDKTALLNSIFDAMPDFVVYKDLDGNIVECNKAALTLANKSKAEVIGKTIADLLPSQTAKLSVDYDEQLKSDLQSANYKIEFKLAGKDVYVDVRKHPVLKNGELVGTVSISRDIKERRNNMEKIATLTKLDHLTKLLNRPSFLKLQDRINRQKSWGIILIDIKRFGQLNKLHGSDIGDNVLLYVRNTIQQTAPQNSHLARIQGDRFAILTDQASTPVRLDYLCSQLSQALNQQISIQGHIIDLAVCIGAANDSSCGQHISQLLSCSEQALNLSRERHYHHESHYHHEHHKHCYTLFDPILEALANAEALLLQEFKQAITDQAIELYYQPIIAADSKRVVGVEALARWHHPHRGLIMPVKFIHLAEKNNLICALGELVIAKACKQLAQWRSQGIEMFVAVNLSPMQFRDPLLISKIKHHIDQHKIPAHCLELEVTESVLMESNRQVEQMLQALIGLGVRLSIDDFGTGYCSLSYLKSMPAHKLKIDRSFVDELELDRTTTAITRSVISLARELNITVTAEGVENAAQMKWLQDQQCDQFQGYLFSRPLPCSKFEQWYQDHHSEQALPASMD